MITLWIGDFRLKQIQKTLTTTQQAANYQFLIDDTADCTWFEDSVVKQLSRLNVINANIVIALGFFDCLYSCSLTSFKIDTIIARYKTAIEQLKSSYSGCNFYFCSVNPVSGDYFFAKNIIKQDILTNKIVEFNSKISENTDINFINSYKYLTDLDFVARDCVYFSSHTCNALCNYIKTEISKTSVGFSFDMSKDSLCTANSYNISIDDMQPNARYIYQYLKNEGWTINAIAGVLGNMQVESKMSPWIWQGTIDGSIIKEDRTQELNMAVLESKEPGYGLVQWTPYYKYTNWCDNNNLAYWDIDSQLYRICWEVANNEQWIPRADKGYNITFSNFTKSNDDPYWLAGAWAFCYERPGSSTGTITEQNNLKIERGNNAIYWYNYLNNFDFDTIKSEPVIAETIRQPNIKIDNMIKDKLNTLVSLYIK